MKPTLEDLAARWDADAKLALPEVLNDLGLLVSQSLTTADRLSAVFTVINTMVAIMSDKDRQDVADALTMYDERMKPIRSRHPINQILNQALETKP